MLPFVDSYAVQSTSLRRVEIIHKPLCKLVRINMRPPSIGRQYQLDCSEYENHALATSWLCCQLLMRSSTLLRLLQYGSTVWATCSYLHIFLYITRAMTFDKIFAGPSPYSKEVGAKTCIQKMNDSHNLPNIMSRPCHQHL